MAANQLQETELGDRYMKPNVSKGQLNDTGHVAQFEYSVLFTCLTCVQNRGDEICMIRMRVFECSRAKICYPAPSRIVF